MLSVFDGFSFSYQLLDLLVLFLEILLMQVPFLQHWILFLTAKHLLTNSEFLQTSPLILLTGPQFSEPPNPLCPLFQKNFLDKNFFLQVEKFNFFPGTIAKFEHLKIQDNELIGYIWNQETKFKREIKEKGLII